MVLNEEANAPSDRQRLPRTWTGKQSRMATHMTCSGTLVGKQIVAPGHHAPLFLFKERIFILLLTRSARLLAHEVHVEHLAACNEQTEYLGGHELSPCGVESPRTCNGSVIALTAKK